MVAVVVLVGNPLGFVVDVPGFTVQVAVQSSPAFVVLVNQIITVVAPVAGVVAAIHVGRGAGIFDKVAFHQIDAAGYQAVIRGCRAAGLVYPGHHHAISIDGFDVVPPEDNIGSRVAVVGADPFQSDPPHDIPLDPGIGNFNDDAAAGFTGLVIVVARAELSIVHIPGISTLVVVVFALYVVGIAVFNHNADTMGGTRAA